MAKNLSKVVTQFLFLYLFSKAWCRGTSVANIMAGFGVTGVFLFNWNALRTDIPKVLVEHAEVKYAPLLSPAPTKCKSKAVTPIFSEDARFRYVLRKDII